VAKFANNYGLAAPSPNVSGAVGRPINDIKYGYPLGLPVFGDIRDPYKTETPRVRFYYFGQLVSMEVPVSQLTEINFVKRSGTGRVAPRVKMDFGSANFYTTGVPAWPSGAARLADGRPTSPPNSSSVTQPITIREAVAEAIDLEAQITGVYKDGETVHVAAQNMNRILADDAATLRIVNDVPAVQRTETYISYGSQAQPLYTIEPLDEDGNVLVPGTGNTGGASGWGTLDISNLASLEIGETVSVTFRVTYNLFTRISRNSSLAGVVGSGTTSTPLLDVMKDRNTAAFPWTTTIPVAPALQGWSGIMTTPIRKNITVLFEKTK